MLGDIWNDVQNVANQLSVSEKGNEFKIETEARIKVVQTRCDNNTARQVLTIEWLDPIYIGGMWLPEMIDIVGGQVCIAKSGQLAPVCLLYTSPSPRDATLSRMPSSA